MSDIFSADQRRDNDARVFQVENLLLGGGCVGVAHSGRGLISLAQAEDVVDLEVVIVLGGEGGFSIKSTHSPRKIEHT